MSAMVLGKKHPSLRKNGKAGPHPVRPTFVALDRFRSKNAGVLVTVELDRDTYDFAHLLGKKIVVDGKMETCFSVARLPHAPPCRKGESVSILIRKGA